MDFLGCHRQELHLPHSSEGHQPPPERVEEGPGPGGVVLLGEVDQGGEGEDRHAHEEHEQAELRGGLVEGGEEGKRQVETRGGDEGWMGLERVEGRMR